MDCVHQFVNSVKGKRRGYARSLVSSNAFSISTEPTEKFLTTEGTERAANDAGELRYS